MSFASSLGASSRGAAVRLVARARLRHHWVGIVVVGLVGALGASGALALAAGASRTDTAHERLRAEIRAFDGRASFLEPEAATPRSAVTRVRLLPEIASSTVARFRVGRRTDTQDWISTTSLPALDAAASRPQIVRGRSFRIENPNEAVLSQSTADAIHLDVGDRLPIDFYSDQQFADVLDDYFVPPVGETAELEIVGVTRDPDDAGGGRTVLVGPAFLAGSESTAGFAGVLFRLAPGVTRADAERAIADLDLGTETPEVTWAADTAQTLDNTRNVVVGALIVAAIVIALAGLIAVMQAAARQVDQIAGDRDALLALGLTRRGRVMAATLPGVLAAAIAGAGALAGAVALSPLFPSGRIQAFEPHPGVSVNLAVLGTGLVVVMGFVVAAFGFAAWRSDRRAERATVRTGPSVIGSRIARWALRPETLMGMRFAVERGPDRNSVPVRTSLVGIATGVAGVIAAITFAASLEGFVSTPAHYGQPWDLSIETLGDRGAPARIAADRDVAGAALVRSIDATVDGRATVVNSVEVLKGSFSPTVESGRLPRGPGEIMLGPKLLDVTGTAIGDDVHVRSRAARTLRVVGTALNLDPQDPSFGTIAFVSPAALRALRDGSGLFNEETAVQFRPGADATAVTERLKAAIPLGLTDESLPSRPPAVANVAELGRLPEVLALVLGVIGAVAVAHSVVLAVRRRRHELGVLAALGMTQRQRAGIVVTMAATMIGIGLVVGIPIGIILGTYVWNVVAEGLRVDFAATVPRLELLAVALAAIGVTLLVALLPARSASRVRPALVLRSG